ncbi:MAG: hypothetical protein JXR71_08095 [Bacteroidales bacterium]|nr:hypothetical protein [Bacteroidales bacterium]
MKEFLFLLPSKMARLHWISILVVLELLFLWAFNGLFPFSIFKLKELSGGLGMPDENLFYSYNQLFRLFDQYGASGRALYLKLQWIDMGYPVVYSLLLGSLLAVFCKNSRFAWMMLLPFLAAVFDLTENILLRIGVLSFPNLDSALVQVASMATFLKWVMLLLTLIALIVGVTARIVLWAKKHNKAVSGVSSN